MTHLPPIPDAASAPYPPRPAPISEEQKMATAAREAAAAQAEAAEAQRQRTTTAVGMGVGAALLVGVAAWGLRYFTRRPVPTPAPTRARRNAGDKSVRGKQQDRARVAAGQPYEVAYFARKHKISAAEARAIIEQAGPDRQAANKLALARK